MNSRIITQNPFFTRPFSCLGTHKKIPVALEFSNIGMLEQCSLKIIIIVCTKGMKAENMPVFLLTSSRTSYLYVF